jgi:hypothetical protein
MHLARVIFFLGGRRDEGSRPGSPAANIPECFRLGAAGSLQIVPTPAGLVEHREPERPSVPDGLAAAPNRQVARTPQNRRPPWRGLAARHAELERQSAINKRRPRMFV